ncbi:RpiB/LacA/LacB family sugar-phosphate isomerase [Streptococcus rifensis]
MKIAVIQASTQAEKNSLLYETTKKVVRKYDYEVLNFGVLPSDTTNYSYTEIAFLIALLLNSDVVDFIITGCSSGQGMNMACNTLPGTLSGFIQTPQDAYLFGRINDGNVASLSLGLGFGWLGELNLEYTLEKLFDGDFGIGYPEDAAKRNESNRVKQFNALSKYHLIDVMKKLDTDFLTKILSKEDVIQYIIHHSTQDDLVDYLKTQLNSLKLNV